MLRYQKIALIIPATLFTAILQATAKDKEFIFDILQNQSSLNAYITAEIWTYVSLTITLGITAWALLSKTKEEN